MTGRAMTACLIACCLAAPAARGGDVFDSRAAEFARKIDVDALELLGAQQSGRTAILDTLARGQLRQMCGSSDVESLPAVFAYLELYFNAGRYVDRPVIHIRERQMRGFIERELTGKAAKAFARTSRISPATLLHEEAWNILARSGRAREADRSRARRVRSLRNALAELAEKKQFRLPIDRLSARYSSYLAVGILRVVPTGDEGWLALEEALITREGRPNPSPPPAAAKWAEMGDAWRRRDAETVNRVVGELSDQLPRAAGKGYPSLRTRKLERLYNRANQGTAVWIGFAVSLALLIVAAATSARWARWAGMGVFCASTAVRSLPHASCSPGSSTSGFTPLMTT